MQNDECGIQNGKTKEDLRARTADYALRIVRLYKSVANDDVARVLGRQLLRSGTSVGAHYREACRARSTAEFVSKMEGGLQELDETLYWIELLVSAQIISAAKTSQLIAETNELIAIFVSSVRTAKHRKQT